MKNVLKAWKQFVIVSALLVFSLLPVTAGQGTASTFFCNVRLQDFGTLRNVRGSVGITKSKTLSGGPFFLETPTGGAVLPVVGFSYEKKENNKTECVIRFPDEDKDGDLDSITVEGETAAGGVKNPKVTEYDVKNQVSDSTQ